MKQMFPCMMVGEHCWGGGCLWYFHYLSELLFSVVLLSVSEFFFDCLVSLTLSGFHLPFFITMSLIKHRLHCYFFHQAICFFILLFNYAIT